MTERQRTPEEKYLLSMRDIARRLFKEGEGSDFLDFVHSTTGFFDPLPLESLQPAEGARRLSCLFHVMLKGWPDQKFLDYCGQYFVHGKLIQ